ncbi:MAG: hypothetical protein CMM05_04350 [Rhodopirellula sp.]|nr:hypothetical protein [Rhodopirellula sp.]
MPEAGFPGRQIRGLRLASRVNPVDHAAPLQAHLVREHHEGDVFGRTSQTMITLMTTELTIAGSEGPATLSFSCQTIAT